MKKIIGGGCNLNGGCDGGCCGGGCCGGDDENDEE